MKTKRWLSVMILAAWLIGSAGNAQQPTDQPVFPPPSPLAVNGTPEQSPPPGAAYTGGLSDWILYRRDCCKGRHGNLTPLYTELFLESGPSIPVGGMTLSRELKTGWSILGGARALFFNESQTCAWVVEGHIINTNESGGAQNTQFPLTFFPNGVRSDEVVFEGVAGRKTFSIQNSNRTLVGAGLGRDWYLWRPADREGRMWRVGVDAGGRYGSHRINLSEFGHLTDVVGGMYAGAHAAMEIPLRSLTLRAGVRFEWAYTWSDILQRTSDVQDLNLLLTVGVRY